MATARIPSEEKKNNNTECICVQIETANEIVCQMV